jgi:ArsR family transcriptional regulator, arsenate/arsenite/antimonite-responsive transcriptional repressor
LEDHYIDYAKMMKAIADPNRLKIIDLLSCEERCACDLLAHFQFTQPTLSHHMKVLMECGLVVCRKDGQWCHYSLNTPVGQQLVSFLMTIMTKKANCVCHDLHGDGK